MMVPFCKLAHPQRYLACSWDLTQDPAGRRYWVGFFIRHLETMLQLGAAAAQRQGESPPAIEARSAACRLEFSACFNRFTADPPSHGKVTILTLDQWRDRILRRHGFADPFADLKDRENAKALDLLPRICRELDALGQPQGLTTAVLGLLAGNIFDMGAGATAKAFLTGGPDFFQTRRDLAPRPWLIDDFDAFQHRILNCPPHRKAVFFIDNAGSDFILGAIPLMRWLARRGTHVVLAANQRPTLNDMTLTDVNAWWPRIIAAEPSLADLPIQRVGTGTGEPLIDLSQISEELNDAAAGADLVILEGMGRGVESNLEAEFSCDALILAMIKDAMVAARHGGKVFDVVCRFRAGSSS
jgi:uncharacterized protein with ATP-grasp and redox domains